MIIAARPAAMATNSLKRPEMWIRRRFLVNFVIGALDFAMPIFSRHSDSATAKRIVSFAAHSCSALVNAACASCCQRSRACLTRCCAFSSAWVRSVSRSALQAVRFLSTTVSEFFAYAEISDLARSRECLYSPSSVSRARTRACTDASSALIARRASSLTCPCGG